MSEKRVVLAGGSGFIGRELARQWLAEGFSVTILSRGAKPIEGCKVVPWDSAGVGTWREEVEGSAVVVNLSGEPIAQRWTPAVRKGIMDSRVNATRAVGKAIQSCLTPPPSWVNASAVGYYGDTGDWESSESSRPGTGFLAEVAQAWEAEVDAHARPDTKAVKLRVGHVLGKDGGALKTLVPLTNMFLGGHLGSGKQWVPWIHIRDLARMVVWAVEQGLEGPINACAPNPVRQSEFMKALRSELARPWSPPVPVFALKVAEAMGIPPAEVLLASQRVVPSLALSRGFRFEFESLDKALTDLL